MRYFLNQSKTILIEKDLHGHRAAAVCYKGEWCKYDPRSYVFITLPEDYSECSEAEATMILFQAHRTYARGPDSEGSDSGPWGTVDELFPPNRK